MKFCPQCGGALGQGVKFCGGCGHQLAGSPQTRPRNDAGFAPFERQAARREKSQRRWVKLTLILGVVPGLVVAAVIVNADMTERANLNALHESRAGQPISMSSPQDMASDSPARNHDEPLDMVLILRRFDLPAPDRNNLPSEDAQGMGDAPGQGGPGLKGPDKLPEPL